MVVDDLVDTLEGEHLVGILEKELHMAAGNIPVVGDKQGRGQDNLTELEGCHH